MAQACTDGEKSADRTRLNNLFQLIDKSLSRFCKKPATEDLQQIRYATSKLCQLISLQDKLNRDLVMKSPGNLDILVNVLQQVSDDQTLLNTISIFSELLGRSTQSGKRASVMVSHGVTTVLFGLLKQVVCQELVLTDELLILIHTVLSKTGHKDRKFAVKARLHRTLLLTLNLIKNHSNVFRFLQQLLLVLKLYTANSMNASYLGKHNAINVMFRVVSACGRKHATCSRLAFENLGNMTKSKSNSARLIGMGGVPLLLSHHADWHHADNKNRYITLRKAILNTLKNITNLKSGRRAFMEAEGIRVLYNSAQEVMEMREVESLVMLASLIMRKCCPRNRLPLDKVLSAVTFPLPTSEFHVPECSSLPEFQASVLSIRQPGEREDSDHSSLDDDDDIDSDDERFRSDTNPDETEDDQGDGLEAPEIRSIDELRMYDKFFPEVFEFDQYISSLDQDSHERLSQRERSSFSLGEENTRKAGTLFSRRWENSFPSLNDDISSVLESSHSRMTETTVVTAVNIKTGASVVSLDFPIGASVSSRIKSSSVTKSLMYKSTGNKKVKPTKKILLSKDKKLKKASSVKGLEDFQEALCITPLPSNRDISEEVDQGTNSGSDDLDDESVEVTHDPQAYQQMAGQTHSVYRFQKLAYPDLCGAKGALEPEPLYNRKFGVQRCKVFEDIDRMIHADTILDSPVYDLDEIITLAGSTYTSENSNLSNRDELRVGRGDGCPGVLNFNAQFECGNLRKVVQVRDFEYDLILSPDINTNHHHQWFYFEVSNMIAKRDYRFNIVNCEKINSQFNAGMQPVMFSVVEALQGRAAWVRTGTDICYYRNHFLRSSTTTGGVKGKGYYTATFSVQFTHGFDVCYLAYHYPYTYTMLRTHLYQWETQVDQNTVFFRNQTLCETLSGNPVPLLTITAQPHGGLREDIEDLWSRPYIFLSARVHPGESNSSWVMKGTVDFLMSNKPLARQLREMYIFKIVPMINPDGVINGNHRSSLVAEDLNRRWMRPCPRLHPTIYHTKGLLQYLSTVNKTPLVYCDYHGHSRRKNIFMYGCSPQQSWMPNDTQNPACSGNRAEDRGAETLPKILHLSCPSFCYKDCSFVVERCKETTARVVVWRQIGVVRSYTMESSYCGCSQGKYKDQHINTKMLEEMGHKFCEALVRLAKNCSAFDQQLPVFGASSAELGGLEDSSLKPSGACLKDLASESEDEGSGDDEENFPEEDEDLTI